MEKPHAPSTEKNREPILAVLREVFADRRLVLEVGSGTGQHAIHFGAQLPHLTWQTSDRPDFLPGIRAWLAEAALPNVLPPCEFDVLGPWPNGRYDAVYSANTLHIMSWEAVEAFFAGLPTFWSRVACSSFTAPSCSMAATPVTATPLSISRCEKRRRIRASAMRPPSTCWPGKAGWNWSSNGPCRRITLSCSGE